MTIQLKSTSRFGGQDSIIVDGVETFGRWVRPRFFDELQDDQIITLKVTTNDVGRPDLIAARFYGTPLLEWVIVMFNRPQEPMGWPLSNDVISFPIAQVVLSEL